MKSIKEYVKYWPVLVLIFTFISSWAVMGFKITLLEQRISKQEEKTEDLPIIRKDLERLDSRLDRRERRPN